MASECWTPTSGSRPSTSASSPGSSLRHPATTPSAPIWRRRRWTGSRRRRPAKASPRAPWRSRREANRPIQPTRDNAPLRSAGEGHFSVLRAICLGRAYRPISGRCCARRYERPCTWLVAWLELARRGNSANQWPLSPWAASTASDRWIGAPSVVVLRPCRRAIVRVLLSAGLGAPDQAWKEGRHDERRDDRHAHNHRVDLRLDGARREPET